MPGILDGIRVIDLSQGIAGALASLLLAEQGADVIKVEPPGGDPTREIEPGFFIWNRSKRGVTLDLNLAADRDRLRTLLERSDVMIESFTIAQSQRFQIDYANLKAAYPHLVHCKISGYGMDHPWRDRPAIEALVAARTGLYHHQTGVRHDGPTFMYCPYANYGAAFTSLLGICGALRVRLHTGRGQFVDTSLMDGVAFFTNMLWQWSEMPVPEFNHFLDHTVPYPVWLYECADGKWLHHMRTDKGNMFALAKVLGIAPPSNAVYLTDAERWKFNDQVIAGFKTRTRDEWIVRLREVDIPVEAVMPAETAFAREQTKVNGMVAVIDDPQRGRVTQVGIPIRFSKTSSAIKGLAPHPGQHDGEVMKQVAAEGAKPLATSIRRIGRDPRHPLDGITVLDCGEYLAGPFGPMALADLGARVIKLERPQGDKMRTPVPFPPFMACQRGKQDLAVDLKHPEGLKIFYKLVQRADVVHHNQRPGVAERLKIDYETLRAIKPDLIYTHSAAYGTRGPDALMGGYDQLFAAMCGMEYMGGGEGNPPVWNRLGTVDAGGATLSAIATVMAVYHRDRTGEGQFVDGSLLNAGLWYNADAFVTDQPGVRRRPNLDRNQTGISATYRMYETAAGWICVAALFEAEWKKFCDAVGRPELAREPKYSSHFGRIDYRDELAAVLEPIFKTRTADEWFERLDRAGVPCEVSNEGYWRKFLQDQWCVESGRVVEYYQGDLFGNLRQFGKTIRLSETPQSIQGPPPRIGEDTQKILAELGYDAAQQEALKESGVITWPQSG
jgi:crotonobetainyl-CoA:carnitine CoA-transferase CaiB-like acyl-CoA transferase